MSGIQSAIGVITGIPIQDTINQLIAISARPRDRLIARTATLKSQQVAFTELTALVIGVQLASDGLGRDETYSQVDVSSSNTAALTVKTTGTPAVGTYSFTPVRQALNQQQLSTRIDSLETAVGAGSIKLKQGGFVSEPQLLDHLNGGQGVQRGQIRITDRLGNSAIVDLRFSQSIDDVIDAINSTASINVTASIEGDSLKLTDNTGATLSNLVVQQIGSATTAADLGLGSVNVASATATGTDIVSLSQATKLSRLNDGSGVDLNQSLPELEVSFRDGTTLQIDFSAEQDLGDILDTINAADPARLSAAISADGDRIELTDLTVDSGGTFAVQSLFGGTTARDLGLEATASGATLSGNRIQGGLNSVLLQSLGGGHGIGELGVIAVTDRSGASVNLDLSSAETLSDVVDLLNASGLDIQASVNSARNGIRIKDESGGTGNLTIQNGVDGLLTADKLGLTIDDAVNSVDSGSLNVATINTNTRLDSLNSGRGVDDSSFIITDSAGAIGAVNIAADGIETIGDLLDAINGLSIGVEARINDQGDGVYLIDTAGGADALKVEESGSGTAAADLGILGTGTSVDLGSGPQSVIDGALTPSIDIDDDDTIDDVIEKINSADAGVTASRFFDGIGYRLSITSNESGKSGRVQLDLSGIGISFDEVVEGRDALILVGSADSVGAGVLASSSTNSFEEVIEGVTLTVKEPSQNPVTVNVQRTSSKVVSSLKLLVEQYNKVIDKLATLRSFNNSGSESNPNISTGILFGSTELLRVEQALGDLVTGRISGAGSIRSLAELGVDVDEEGKLSFDQEKFDAKYASDPNAISSFFQTEEFGLSVRFKTEIDKLTGVGDSLL
ncbi:MAG: flagellar filament capping protein FliD, partial [Planctomycetales bacterium]|nr:flagellar filament capping protein FliD [Planctomycetales bacterium]